MREQRTAKYHRYIDMLWEDLINRDDRTSPAEYPDMALISKAELAQFVHAGGLAQLGSAVVDVVLERQRQVTVEGWTAEHDDMHVGGELSLAAGIYAVPAEKRIHWDGEPAPAAWPWHPSWWKPTDRRRDLIKAAALIIADIERLDRAAAKS